MSKREVSEKNVKNAGSGIKSSLFETENLVALQKAKRGDPLDAKELELVCKVSIARGKTCLVCKKVFTGKVRLRRHAVAVHLRLKPYACEECDKAFGEKGNLEKHVKTVHRGEKDYKCEECDKAFGYKAYLKKHVKIVHRGDKDYKCEECDKAFGEKGSLKTHVKTVHRGEKDYKCEECDKAFGRKTSLKTHVKTVHRKGRPTRAQISKKETALRNYFRSLGLAEDKVAQRSLPATPNCPGNIIFLDFCMITDKKTIIVVECNEFWHRLYTPLKEVKRDVITMRRLQHLHPGHKIRIIHWNPDTYKIDNVSYCKNANPYRGGCPRHSNCVRSPSVDERYQALLDEMSMPFKNDEELIWMYYPITDGDIEHLWNAGEKLMSETGMDWVHLYGEATFVN